jgi:hypothetical protein
MNRTSLSMPLAAALMVLSAATMAQSRSTPKVAVTELAYQRQVSEYFEVSQERSSASMQATPRTMASNQQYEGTYVAGTHSYIQQGELRNFTADLKGLILKGGGAQLVQPRAFDSGTPQPTQAERVLNQVQTGKMARPVKQPDVNDIIARIRKGEFSGADYVLFGEVASVQFRDELSPLQGTTTTSYLFSLDLGVTFNLINTKTYEIKSSFMSSGAGSEVKLISRRGDLVSPNRTKVIRETSLTLADDAYGQLLDQLGVGDPSFGRRPTGGSQNVSSPAAPQKPAEPVVTFR